MYSLHNRHSRHNKKQHRVPRRLLAAVLASIVCTGLGASTVLYAQPILQTGPARGTAALISDNLQNKVLPVETAFPLRVLAADANTIMVQWQINAGYYLYRKSISITRADGVTIETLALPTGTTINDEYFGKVEVYFDQLSFSVPTAALMPATSGAAAPQLDFTLAYQGCAEDLYCYPPQQQAISLALP